MGLQVKPEDVLWPSSAANRHEAIMKDPRLLGPSKTPKERLRSFVKHRIVNAARYRKDVKAVRVIAAARGVKPRRIALVSDGLAGCSEDQLYPFRYFREQLLQEKAIVSCQVRLDDVLGGKVSLRSFDIVALKMTYRTDAAQALSISARICELATGKMVVYLDGDDDICVQWADVLRKMDVYIKKHVFADSRRYTESFAGKSNLHDYVIREHDHHLSPLDYGGDNDVPVVIESTGPIPEDLLGKIQLGWNIGLDRKIMDLYEQVRDTPINHDRPYDVAFRGSVKPETFSYHLRHPVQAELEPLASRFKLLIGSSRVTQEEYYQELKSSRICVSPFGFGELCWRDFEAVLCGTLLIKPDMSHLSTSPNIFVAGETYASVRWDFADLAKVCVFYLENEAERRRLVENAYKALTEYYETGALVQAVDRLFQAGNGTASDRTYV